MSSKQVVNSQFEDVLDLNPKPIEAKEKPKPITPISDSDSDTRDIDNDYQLARETYHDLLSLSKDHLENAGDIADQTENARDYEVFFDGLKKTSEIAEKLMQHQQNYIEVKNKKSGPQPDGPDVVNNTLVLTTEQMQEFLEKKKDN